MKGTEKRLALDINCPACSKRAVFQEPFEFVSKEQADPQESRPTHTWGGWVVIERYPSQYSWHAPSSTQPYLKRGGADTGGGYPLFTHGMVQCSHCHDNTAHTLNWPSDAYWQWSIRGELLWAWDEQHTRQVLAYIREVVRPLRSASSLRYIPSSFLAAKVRDEVVQKIEKSLKTIQ